MSRGADGARRRRSARRRRLVVVPPGPAPLGPGAADANDLAMMDRAIALAAQAADEGEVPVGAVVYRGAEVLAEGRNRREAEGDPTGHAELLALVAAGRARGGWRLADCTLAVTLEPCPMCAGAVVAARLGRLVYGAADLKAGACASLYRIPTDPRLNHRVEVIAGVRGPACAALLTAFFRDRRTAAGGAA